jgi:hypothetical protein
MAGGAILAVTRSMTWAYIAYAFRKLAFNRGFGFIIIIDDDFQQFFRTGFDAGSAPVASIRIDGYIVFS